MLYTYQYLYIYILISMYMHIYIDIFIFLNIDRYYASGQIIATSHNITPKWCFSKRKPLISGKSRLVKYYNLARYLC